MEENCMFCDSKIVHRDGCYVCDTCKTIRFTKGISAEQIYESIAKYLNTVQNRILAKREEYYSLEQKYLSGLLLTEEEQYKR